VPGEPDAGRETGMAREAVYQVDASDESEYGSSKTDFR
jgi:hypothetical protein